METKKVKRLKKYALKNVLYIGNADAYWALLDKIFLGYLGTEDNLELSNEERRLILTLYNQLDKYFLKQMTKQEKWEEKYEKAHPGVNLKNLKEAAKEVKTA